MKGVLVVVAAIAAVIVAAMTITTTIVTVKGKPWNYQPHLNKKDYYQEMEKHKDNSIHDVDINKYSSYISARATAQCLINLASYSKNGRSDSESFEREVDSLNAFLSKMEIFAKDKKEDEFYTKSFLLEYSQFVSSEAKYDDLDHD